MEYRICERDDNLIKTGLDIQHKDQIEDSYVAKLMLIYVLDYHARGLGLLSQSFKHSCNRDNDTEDVICQYPWNEANIPD